jgi:aspartyl protease family protein
MHDPWHKDGDQPKPKRRLPLFWLFAAAVATLIGLLIWRFPYALEGQGAWAHLIYLLCFLALIAGGVFRTGLRVGQFVRYAAIWIGIAGIAGLGYAYRFELVAVKDRMLGELVPGVGVKGPGGEILFRADVSGHFNVEALVDGVPVRFLVDTGASDVVLSPRDARRIGFDPAGLDYSRRYRTANGIVSGAPVTLDSVRIGPIEVRDVAGSVNGAPLDASLLGMSFLERLRGYRVENGTLILQQ